MEVPPLDVRYMFLVFVVGGVFHIPADGICSCSRVIGDKREIL